MRPHFSWCRGELLEPNTNPGGPPAQSCATCGRVTPRGAETSRACTEWRCGMTDSPIHDLIADLDLLDDDHRHAICMLCNPDHRPGRPFIGLCGRRAVGLRGEDSVTPPPNACPECLALFGGPCLRCGG
jgi:hypothetical protein